MASGGMAEIGKYRILDRIGEGAMGVVYRAHDPVLNRPVAIKVMAESVARDDLLRGRFLREAQAAGSLQHPNVITIYDFGEVDGHLFIAMEYIEGEDLEAIQLNKRPLSPLQRIDIIIDVLGGLAYAHKRGIVHRDIKPANIRIDLEGRARIMDFGIAHLSSSTMTRTGTTVGTPAYMAPEQVVGGEIVPASDLFSVGAVMFELLTGRKPFDAENLHSLFFSIVSGPTPHIDEVASGLPASLDAIVQKALAKEPEQRYASAIEMANALTAVRQEVDSLARQSHSVSLRSQIDLELAARPTVLTSEMQVTRRRTVYASAGGGAVLLAAGLVVYFGMHGPATPSRVATEVRAPVGSPVATQPQGNSVSPAGVPVVTPPAPPAKSPPIDSARPTARAVARDLEVFRSLQSTALEARRRASEAGATAEQLKSGDDLGDRASALALEGKTTDAAARLNAATRSWLNAESDARAATNAANAITAAAAAAAAASKQRSAEPEKSAPPVVAPAGVQVAPPPVVSAPIPAAPVANAATEIATVVAAYARAIDSRDIAEVRRAYPGVTRAQATGFDQFFSSVRSLRATLAVSALDVQGATAEGKVSGAYDFVTKSGKAERQPVDFQASFRKEGTVWKLVLVR